MKTKGLKKRTLQQAYNMLEAAAYLIQFDESASRLRRGHFTQICWHYYCRNTDSEADEETADHKGPINPKRPQSYVARDLTATNTELKGVTVGCIIEPLCCQQWGGQGLT
jgi:hypothetical protein